VTAFSKVRESNSEPSISTSIERAWYWSRNGQQYGPISDLQLSDLVEHDQLRPDDYLWCSELAEWFRFGDLKSITSKRKPRRRYLRSFIQFVRRKIAAEPISLGKKVWILQVVGSNPAAPTTKTLKLREKANRCRPAMARLGPCRHRVGTQRRPGRTRWGGWALWRKRLDMEDSQLTRESRSYVYSRSPKPLPR
jgi:GYF domain 2